MLRNGRQLYEMKLAGQRLFYVFDHKEAVTWFEWHMKPFTDPAASKMTTSDLSAQYYVTLDSSAPYPVTSDSSASSLAATHLIAACDSISPLHVPKELIRLRRPDFGPDIPDSYLEYRVCAEVTGRALADRGCFIFHATAFFWRGYAWLLTAPSGTGKSTQFHNWKMLWPNEVSILCGDMPVLSLDDEGTVWAHPSPWNGKEREGFENHECAPLGGIVFLKQGPEDSILEAPLDRLVRPVWHQFIGQADNALQIRNREHFLDHMLRHYPLWTLENRGDCRSAQMTRAVFDKHLRRSLR